MFLFLLRSLAIQTKQTLEKVYFYHERADKIKNKESNSQYNKTKITGKIVMFIKCYYCLWILTVCNIVLLWNEAASVLSIFA